MNVPGSKSVTNRALLLAALARGRSILEGALFSDDTQYFLRALRDLGFDVCGNRRDQTMTVNGLGGRIPASKADLFIGLAGTAARFLTAFLTLGSGEYRLDGTERMRERPLGPLLESLRELGADVVDVEGSGCPPLLIRAHGLNGGETTVDASTSSQFLSALLLSAPYARSDVKIRVEDNLAAPPYVEMTVRMMQAFGVEVDRDGYRWFSIPTGQCYRAQHYWIEPDASSASYFFAAAALTGGRVRVPHLSRQSLQGDVGFVDVLADMGCTVNETDEGIEVQGPRGGRLSGIEVDLNHMSDMTLTLAALAPFASSPVHITNVGHIRTQETDRLRALTVELQRLGIHVQTSRDAVTIHPGEIQPAVVQTYGDHRMAMSFALIGLRIPGIQIADPGCTAKTFPDYFQRLATLNSSST